MRESLAPLPVRQTYLACGDLSLNSIKIALGDKSKVSLSRDEGNKLFQILEDGQQLSTGLNVVLGGRSTGKSHTLDRISQAGGEVKYLKQFSLVQRDEVEDERRFNERLSTNKSLLTEDFLAPLKPVVHDLLDVDLEMDQRNVEKYLGTLIAHANRTDREDSYSNAELFNGEPFQVRSLESIENVINATKTLIHNEEYRGIIDKHIDVESLRSLVIELLKKQSDERLANLKKVWVNELISDIQSQLRFQTASTVVEDVNLYEVALNLKKASRFREVTRMAQRKRVIESQNVRHFQIIATADAFDGAMELQKLSKSKKKFSTAFEKYGDPYLYLKELEDIEGLPAAELYKYFVKVEFRINNKDGVEVSGGERSEFQLLDQIKTALDYDILLIDEPESSFDNLFLKDDVNELIRDISKTIPVVVVTHNSTIGASIKPDYVLYTAKENLDGETVFKIYSGYPTDKELVSTCGQAVSTYSVLLDSLEAGEGAYEERKKGYENIKN